MIADLQGVLGATGPGHVVYRLLGAVLSATSGAGRLEDLGGISGLLEKKPKIPASDGVAERGMGVAEVAGVLVRWAG